MPVGRRQLFETMQGRTIRLSTTRFLPRENETSRWANKHMLHCAVRSYCHARHHDDAVPRGQGESTRIEPLGIRIHSANVEVESVGAVLVAPLVAKPQGATICR